MRYLYLVLTILVFSSQLSSAPLVIRADLDGPIDVIHTQYVLRALDEAIKKDASLFLVVLDTPGGLGKSMQKIIKRFLSAPMPVVVYVYPPGSRAASAGFFILISADVAAMAPGTRTGAAHPILEFGGMPVGSKKKEEKEGKDTGDSTEILLEKVTQDVLAYIRSIARIRGRDVDLAVKAVTQSKSYSDEEALKGKLIDLRASDVQELLKELDGHEVKRVSGKTAVLHTANAVVEKVPMTFREKALSLITDPNVAFLLGLLGLVLLYVEITHTGLVVPGVVGGICLLLAVMGFSYLPINVTGVLLIALAFGLFIAELKMPGFGIMGTLGIVSLALGAIMLVNKTDLGVSVDLTTAVSGAVAFGVIFLFLSYLVLKSHRRRKMAGREEIIGAVGEALTDLDPEGKVLVQGTYWTARAAERIPKGAPVRVKEIKGLKLLVEPAKEEPCSNC